MSSRDSSTRNPRKPEAKASLSGKRILVVEDSPVVAPFTADVLGELGCEVVGPAPNMAAARELIEGEAIDGALMDVHIRGERVFPLCDLLESRAVPFILTSGYADWQIPEKLESRPRLQKPYTIEQVEKALAKLLR
ncbi:response regulator [Sphingomonas segetis]|jgi:CheY-like chemotaxis protein|uniref:response regulator n=1 Tax=Sphingomonas segetis TaxID=1104779 RepID=UPI0012D34C5E|nr:response regulator [Sphingomonas segetis]